MDDNDAKLIAEENLTEEQYAEWLEVKMTELFNPD